MVDTGSPNIVGVGDRAHGDQLGAGTLSIGQMGFADLLAVTTMRFQPTMVPSPSAMGTETLTQNGMYLVASSSSP